MKDTQTLCQNQLIRLVNKCVISLRASHKIGMKTIQFLHHDGLSVAPKI